MVYIPSKYYKNQLHLNEAGTVVEAGNSIGLLKSIWLRHENPDIHYVNCALSYDFLIKV